MEISRDAIEGDIVGRAFSEAMTRKGLTQEELATRIEERTGRRVAQSTISNWTRGLKVPSTRLLPVVLRVLDLTWEDIGAGMQQSKTTPAADSEGPHDELASEVEGDRPPLSELSVVVVPRMACASAGSGYENGELPEIEGYEAYPLEEVRRLTHISPKDLRAIKVIGDSMEPELPSGASVVYAPAETVGEPGIYVLGVDDSVLVKRIQRLGGGALVTIPTNPLYHRETYLPVREADEPNTYRSKETGLVAQIRIIGRAVFYMNAL